MSTSHVSSTSTPHATSQRHVLAPTDSFARRHLGPDAAEIGAMLETVGYPTLDALIDAAVPDDIRLRAPLHLPAPLSESEALTTLRQMLAGNRVLRSFIGMGYYDCLTPPVIQRNILENPGWYTQYTPYQAEIAQGRLEALLNFQTMVCDLTGMDIANASLLDEATAAAEAIALAAALKAKDGRRTVLVSNECHPQTIAVVQTRAEPLGLAVEVAPHDALVPHAGTVAVLTQYPASDGLVRDLEPLAQSVRDAGALFVVAADLLALCVLRPPGEFGADIVLGSTQRFGVPLGYGGPHAAFFATRDAYKRLMPGRLIGVSKDAEGRTAYRMALQTREQHIRREKATSNICTAQVLLAIMASMYAVYHGSAGLRRIAGRVHLLAELLASSLRALGHTIVHPTFFDTLCVECHGCSSDDVLAAALRHGINLRRLSPRRVGIALDEAVTMDQLRALHAAFAEASFNFGPGALLKPEELADEVEPNFPAPLARTSPFLEHPVFQRHHTETEMLRYIRRLESRDLSLTTSMIPLGSCTMKLNATTEMIPVTWPEVGRLHPFAPGDQAAGFHALFNDLERWLAEITGFPAVSLQPNAGSQGEFAGLLVIRAYHRARGDTARDVCLIPTSAHGTNPASAVLAGLRVQPVKCDAAGNIDLADLKARIAEHPDTVAALMVTYPSTHGVFETTIREVCQIVHEAGGQVYMDGANLNAQVGLCRPADFGADVCHLNLHKTFCIPHGGGGPGMGPIAAARHLAPFLPTHPVIPTGGLQAAGVVSAAPWGSPSILTIPWLYIAMMGAAGLTEATRLAILNANYIAARLGDTVQVLFTGRNRLVAHECIFDLRPWKTRANIEPEDVAKRLMDYGFHAPTMSWPVPGTLMVEPTESESQAELDRFCDALLAISREVDAIAEGRADRLNNPLKRAPHTAAAVTADHWDRPYSRQEAAFPAPWTLEHKFWPAVARIDNVYGDRHLFCSCPS